MPVTDLLERNHKLYGGSCLSRIESYNEGYKKDNMEGI